MNIFLLIIGLISLIVAADYFVDSSVSLANNYKLPISIIGLTVVAFGANAPELSIAIFSALNNNHEMIFASVFGSNIINILLVTGLAIVINPFRVKIATIKKEIPILLLITFGTTIMFLDKYLSNQSVNSISRGDALILLLQFGVFLYYLVHLFRKRNKDKDIYETPKYSKVMSIFLVIICLIVIIISSSLIVENAIIIANNFNISDKLIGLTVLVFATALPEIIITINAARKKETEFIVANIIGSNIFNLSIVLGIPALITKDLVSHTINYGDLFFLNASVILLMLFSYNDKRLERGEGKILLFAFVLYYIFTFATI